MSLAESTNARSRRADSTSWSDLDLTQFEIVAGAAALSLLVIGTYLNESGAERASLGIVVQFCAATIAALPVLFRALAGLVRPTADSYSDQLLMIAVMAAVLFGEYVTAVVVPLIMTIGHVVERRNVQGVQAAIDGLRQLQARDAIIVVGSEERSVAVEALRVDDRLIVQPGDVIAADGLVEHGHSAVDEASITGESLPRDAAEGDEVFAGTINLFGRLRIRVTRTGGDTSIGLVSKLLAEAIESKTPTMRLVERCAEYYIPAVVLVAAFTFWVTRDFARVLTMLIVACPCALVLAGPASTIAALAVAARRGILIKSGGRLDILGGVDTVVFDKTGTLTHGEVRLAAVRPTDGIAEADLLMVAARCAHGSKHPLSEAVRKGAVGGGDSETPNAMSREYPGCGVELRIGDETLRFGKPDWLRSNHVAVPDAPAHSGPLAAAARDRTFLGHLLFEDRVRSEARQARDQLSELGIDRFILLTGDRAATAERVAREVGCDIVRAEMLPADKLSAVEAERRSGRRVVVIGDGINDAPALAAGDVGIAMGARGSDIAIRSADIALMSNDLRRIPEAIRLARALRSNILQNIAIAGGCVVAMLVFGASGMIGPVAGAVLHNGGTVLVLVNAARLLREPADAESAPRLVED